MCGDVGVQASGPKSPSPHLLLISWPRGVCLPAVGSSVSTLSVLVWVSFYAKPFVPQLPISPSRLFPRFGASVALWGPGDAIPGLCLPTEAENYSPWGGLVAWCAFFGLCALGEGDGDSAVAHARASPSIYRWVLAMFPRLQGVKAISQSQTEGGDWGGKFLPPCPFALLIWVIPSSPRLGHNPSFAAPTSPSQLGANPSLQHGQHPFHQLLWEPRGQGSLFFSGETRACYS